jgi:hypothetical protein
VAEEQAKAPEEGEELILTEGDQAPEGQEEGGDKTPSLEDLAKDMGWRPREEFRGDPDQWKPAADFIRAGHEIQRNLSHDLKNLRTTVDTIKVTTSEVMRQKLEEQKRELAAQYAQAVEDGDTRGSYQIAQRLTDVDRQIQSPVAQPQAGPPPGVQEFIQRNASWYEKDKLATERAVRITNELAAKNYSVEYQLAEAERVVKQEFPHLFQAPKQTAPSTHSSTRATGGTSNGKKGFAHMPLEAQKVATHMFNEHGVDKELYAKNYFANLEGGQKRG